MISIKNLTKSYKKTKVVDNLNLEIKTGSIFGFLGPNGAGKTTTMKIIVGISKATTGEVKIDDKPVNRKQARQNLGYMPEDPYFYDHLSSLEFMSFMGSLFKKRSKLSNAQILDMVGLKNDKNKKISKFSKGMKQRLGLAQSIINDPEYLFLDEPLDGLDPIGRQEFKKIILDLKKKGKTIFFNSHILSDVEEICDQIGIINKGKLIYNGPVKKFRGSKSLEEAFVDKLT